MARHWQDFGEGADGPLQIIKGERHALLLGDHEADATVGVYEVDEDGELGGQIALMSFLDVETAKKSLIDFSVD